MDILEIQGLFQQLPTILRHWIHILMADRKCDCYYSIPRKWNHSFFHVFSLNLPTSFKLRAAWIIGAPQTERESITLGIRGQAGQGQLPWSTWTCALRHCQNIPKRYTVSSVWNKGSRFNSTFNVYSFSSGKAMKYKSRSPYIGRRDERSVKLQKALDIFWGMTPAADGEGGGCWCVCVCCHMVYFGMSRLVRLVATPVSLPLQYVT